MERTSVLYQDLPEGWKTALDHESGSLYYWQVHDPLGTTTWTRPAGPIRQQELDPSMWLFGPRTTSVRVPSTYAELSRQMGLPSSSSSSSSGTTVPPVDYRFADSENAHSLRKTEDWEEILRLKANKCYVDLGRDEDGQQLPKGFLGPYHLVFEDRNEEHWLPKAVSREAMQKFMVMKGFRIDSVMPYADYDRRTSDKQRKNADGTPAIYFSLETMEVCVDGRMFQTAGRPGGLKIFAHITLGYIFLNGLDRKERRDLPGIVCDICRDDCGDILKKIEGPYVKSNNLDYLVNESNEDPLVEINDDQLEFLFYAIIDKVVEGLALLFRERPCQTRTRFSVPRPPFHLRLKSKFYRPYQMELLYEDF